jgi:hypothetical protein
MATTIINSISVKPFCNLFTFISLVQRKDSAPILEQLACHADTRLERVRA